MIKRREFLKQSIVGSATILTSPFFVPSTVFGSNAPSNRINMGFIGVGGMGTNNLRGFINNPDVQVIAVCDVVTASDQYGHWYQNGWKGPWFGRESARNIVNDFYGHQNRSGKYQGCLAFNDFREVLNLEDIDAVCITTPDHWHAIPTILAAKAGKDIYCEKPLSLTIAEGRAMVEAVRRYGVVFQTGSHHRSNAINRFACELVRNGRIGIVKRALTTLPRHGKRTEIPTWQPQPIPDGFDYNLWLGPAPWAPYHPQRCLYTFRFIQDYSGGETTNTGAHFFDLVQWALGTEYSGPVVVENLGSEFPASGLYDVVSRIHFRAEYDNGVELVCAPDLSIQGMTRIEGTDGWVDFGGGVLQTSPGSIKNSVIGPNEIHLYASTDHKRDFLNCIKTRTDPIAPIEVGFKSASICLIANIAMKLRKKLNWNPQKDMFVNDDEANSFLGKPGRAPWQL
jgi:predicted dehydrogenase